MKIKKLWFDNEKIFVLTDDEKQLWQSLLWYPRLQNATQEQRNNYRITNTGIRWEEIDEDMSFESFFYDEPEPTGIAKVFHQYPELNVSAIARRMGMKQSLLAAYVSGSKKPSIERTKAIEKTIHNFGKELSAIQF
ncbi:MAG: DUF2442 domain-containing protein [Candidatus Symbiothrix sp.]|jgi:hypothetical protein|nr:DUF2442 domain-containing protein [Candidatus Symbiothrix sp.]